MRRCIWAAVTAVTLVGLAGVALAAGEADGKAVYDSSCVACHGTGVLGAPKLGDTAAWRSRAAGGLAALVSSARAGRGAMPPKGGNSALSDAQLLGVVTYMVTQSGALPVAAPASKPVVAPAPSPGAAPAAKAVPPAPRVAATVRPAPAAPASAAASASAAPVVASAAVKAPPVAAAVPVAPAASAAAAAAVAPPQVAAATSVNSFNRLLRPTQRNRPPAEDLIHDPGNDGTLALQAPLLAFNDLPRSNAGNRVDWVKSLAEGKIAPRADRLDAKAVPAVMDLNIVREVKGSMPDVVYPHKQHTEWLDCSNCHPAIFKPQKGANQISMAAILLGEACGVCHGKVAFPVSECRLCHSKAKPTATAAAGVDPHPSAPK